MLSLSNTPCSPDSGAAGTTYQTNLALKRLGVNVSEIWEADLGKRWIGHGNLHSLLEQPRLYRKAMLTALKTRSFDAIISQQPQSYLAAQKHRLLKRQGVFVTMSQGVENRIAPILVNHKLNLHRQRRAIVRRCASWLLGKLLTRQWTAAAKYSDGIIVQHTEDRDFICGEFSIEPERVHISHSGLANCFLLTPRVAMNADRLTKMICVGQVAAYKGIRYLGQIVTKLLRSNSSATLTWVCPQAGFGDALSLFAADVADRVHLKAWSTQESLVSELDQHGVFVFPTIAEGFAKAPLEAMSRGLCVVASNCSGMRDYMSDGVNGFLCPVGAIDEFADRIEAVQRSLGAAVQISKNAIQSSQEFTWDRTARRLEEFLLFLLSHR